MSVAENPFPTVKKLADLCGCEWKGYQLAAERTLKAENALSNALALADIQGRSLDADSSLVLFGSFARREFLEGSDYDWALLIDGVVNARHVQQARDISAALAKANLVKPGTTGIFGGLFFSHDRQPKP